MQEQKKKAISTVFRARKYVIEEKPFEKLDWNDLVEQRQVERAGQARKLHSEWKENWRGHKYRKGWDKGSQPPRTKYHAWTAPISWYTVPSDLQNTRDTLTHPRHSYNPVNKTGLTTYSCPHPGGGRVPWRKTFHSCSWKNHLKISHRGWTGTRNFITIMYSSEICMRNFLGVELKPSPWPGLPVIQILPSIKTKCFSSAVFNLGLKISLMFHDLKTPRQSSDSAVFVRYYCSHPEVSPKEMEDNAVLTGSN